MNSDNNTLERDADQIFMDDMAGMLFDEAAVPGEHRQMIYDAYLEADEKHPGRKSLQSWIDEYWTVVKQMQQQEMQRLAGVIDRSIQKEGTRSKAVQKAVDRQWTPPRRKLR